MKEELLMSEAKKAAVKDKRKMTFTKSQVLASKNLRYSKDLVNAILEEGESYTLKEVETMITKYLKGRVR